VSPKRVEEATLAHEFHSVIPNVATCEYSQLIPTGLVRDRLSSGARQIANLIAFDQSYQTALGDALLRYAGTYDSATWYQPRQWVDHDGGSWFSRANFAHAGNTPFVGSAFWTPLALRGANGTGTAGNNTAYNATTWNGQTDAPSRNAVRNIIETLARTSQLSSYALIASPTFTGTPTRNANPAANDRSLQLPTTQWIGNEFAPLNNAALIGSPTAPTAAAFNDTEAIATTRWVNNRTRRIIADRYTSQTLTPAAFTAIVLTTKYNDPDNLFNATTGVFTPTADGNYDFNFSLAVTTTGSTSNTLVASIFVGSAENYRLWESVNAGASTVMSPGCTIFLSAGSAVSVRIFVNGSGITGATLNASQSFHLNRWAIART
jgi:hypothetical protein